MPLVFGYARVSTDGQTLEAQVMQLKAAGAGVGGGKVFREKVSGAARNRPPVLGGLAEFERELIRARTSEGRAKAKADGKKMGRPYKLTPHQRQECRASTSLTATDNQDGRL